MTLAVHIPYYFLNHFYRKIVKEREVPVFYIASNLAILHWQFIEGSFQLIFGDDKQYFGFNISMPLYLVLLGVNYLIYIRKDYTKSIDKEFKKISKRRKNVYRILFFLFVFICFALMIWSSYLIRMENIN